MNDCVKKIIASFLSLSMLSSCGAEPVQNETAAHTLTYTAEILEDIEIGADVSETKPFSLTMTLPVGWRLSELETDEEGYPPSASICDENGAVLGSVQINTYIPDKELSSEKNYYRYVYSQLMLGSFVSWDVDYTPVKEGEVFCNATCTVMTDRHDGGEIQYNKGILAYNDNLGVYTNVYFSADIAAEVQKSVAESVVISKLV